MELFGSLAVNGNFRCEDDDEGIMLWVTFHNEFSSFNRDEKLRIGRAAVSECIQVLKERHGISAPVEVTEELEIGVSISEPPAGFGKEPDVRHPDTVLLDWIEKRWADDEDCPLTWDGESFVPVCESGVWPSDLSLRDAIYLAMRAEQKKRG